MNLIEFNEKIANNPNPVVVDFWASWCGPCKALDPILHDVAQKYVEKVDVLKVDADASPEVLRSLGIMGIPTVIGYMNGKEVIRKTGLQPKTSVEQIFSSLAEGKSDIRIQTSSFDRILRITIGTGFFLFGILRGPSVLLMILGAVIVFSGVYDRCPVYQVVSQKIKSAFSKQTGSSS
ncbi:MAG: trxA [Chloroflexi bacterium]|nr:MAG: trxA [Chloroflexota bacterium]MBA4375498.1 thioredoxin [Anaerolinea sp.]